MALPDLIGFTLVAAILVLTPGADTLLVASAAARCATAGRLTALGTIVGCLAWGILAASGVAAVLQSSPLAFLLLKWVGAAYLGWLGLHYLRGDPSAKYTSLPTDGVVRVGFKHGLITNLSNPKIGIFYLTILPQFATHTGQPTLGFLLMAIIHALIGLVYFALMILAVRSFPAVYPHGSWERG